MRSLSVPLKNPTGAMIGVLSISVNAQKMALEQLVTQCLPLLFESQVLLRDLL